MVRKKRVMKNKGASNPTSGPQGSITLRQEVTGKLNHKISNNVKTYLNHLESLATWASGQASIPSLAAFFGHRLAAAAESSAVSPNPSLFLCQRCETVLQPGSNCSIRIEKNNGKRRRRHNKCSNSTQNNVAYYCHYCSCRNIKRGTPKGHMKVLYDIQFERKVKLMDVKDDKECETSAVKIATEILTIDAPKLSPPTTGDILTIDTPTIPLSIGNILTTDAPTIPPTTGNILTTNAPTIPPTTGDILTVDAPATPSTTIGMTLLDSKKRKRKKPSSKNQTEPESSSAPTSDGDKTGGTSKRKRKKNPWTSLKEIAQTNEQSGKQNMAELAIPFYL